MTIFRFETNRVNHVVPVGASEPQMRHAAMEKEMRKLAGLGERYRRLAEDGMIWLMNRCEIEKRLLAALEELARVEYERWSHWQRYLHSKGMRMNDGSLVIP